MSTEIKKNLMIMVGISRDEVEYLKRFKKSVKKLSKILATINNNELNRKFISAENRFGDSHTELKKHIGEIYEELLALFEQSNVTESKSLLLHDIISVLEVANLVKGIGFFVIGGVATVPLSIVSTSVYLYQKNKWVLEALSYKSFYENDMSKYLKTLEQTIGMLDNLPQFKEKNIISKLFAGQVYDIRMSISRTYLALKEFTDLFKYIRKNRRKYLKREG